VLIGRRAERERIVACFASGRGPSATFVVEGPAGIGKTALVTSIDDEARAVDACVLVAHPTPAESLLPFAALGDLLRGLDLSRLDDASRLALRVALGREAGQRPPLTSELGAALAALLEANAADRPVVVLVDDAQWLDRASHDVVMFAIRRMPTAGVCVVVAQRVPGGGEAAPFEVRGAERIVLGPLDERSIAQIATRSAPVVPPDHLLARIVAAAAGNPLYAVQLALGVDVGGAALRPLPVPRSLEAVVSARLVALPDSTVDALAATSMLAHPTVDVLDDLGLLDDLEPAERAGIVELRERRVSFTHPLLASAAYDRIPGTRRLRLHRRLAEATEGTERCIHLALGATRPDAAIAAELDGAVVAEIARGAPAEAAAMATSSLDLTPADDVRRWERRLLAGDALFRAGRTEEAIDVIRQVVDAAPDPEQRAAALLALATIEFAHVDDAAAATALALQALETTLDPARKAEAHTILSRAIHTDFTEATRHADAALEILPTLRDLDPLVLAQTLTASAEGHFRLGDGLDRATFARAIELENGHAVSVADSAAGALAALLKYADQLDEARAMFDVLARQADTGSLPYVLGHLPQLHLWSGRWDEAERCAREHLDLAERTTQESQVFAARFNLAVIAAHRGEVDVARPLAQALYDEGRSGAVPWTERNGAALLGFLAMSDGDALLAAHHFGRYDELGEQLHLYEPGYARFHGDYVEALVATGRIEHAAEVVDRLMRRAERTDRASARAAALRGRALVAAHGGDGDAAAAAARAAVAALAGTPLVYDQARALLTMGIVARRFRDRAVAHEALSSALDALERMGAASLAARARRELERVDGRNGRSTLLTASESRVAELAANGQTTRQIADTLFISPKTVEANLTRIYRKLGIANRAQLAQRMARET